MEVDEDDAGGRFRRARPPLNPLRSHAPMHPASSPTSAERVSQKRILVSALAYPATAVELVKRREVLDATGRAIG